MVDAVLSRWLERLPEPRLWSQAATGIYIDEGQLLVPGPHPTDGLHGRYSDDPSHLHEALQ